MFYKRRVRKKPFIRDFIFRDQRAQHLLRRSASLVMYSGMPGLSFLQTVKSQASSRLALAASAVSHPATAIKNYLWLASAVWLLYLVLAPLQFRSFFGCMRALTVTRLQLANQSFGMTPFSPRLVLGSPGPISPSRLRSSSCGSTAWFHVMGLIADAARAQWHLASATKCFTGTSFVNKTAALADCCAVVLGLFGSLLRAAGVGFMPLANPAQPISRHSRFSLAALGLTLGASSPGLARPALGSRERMPQLLKGVALGRRYKTRMPWRVWRSIRRMLRWKLYPLQRKRRSLYGSPLWEGSPRLFPGLSGFRRLARVDYRATALTSRWVGLRPSARSLRMALGRQRYQSRRLRRGLRQAQLCLDRGSASYDVHAAVRTINRLAGEDIYDLHSIRHRLLSTGRLISQLRSLQTRGLRSALLGARSKVYLSKGRWVIYANRGGFGSRFHEVLAMARPVLMARRGLHKISRTLHWLSYIRRGLHRYPEVGVRAYNMVVQLQKYFLRARDTAYKFITRAARLYWDNYQVKGWAYAFNKGTLILKKQHFLSRLALSEAYYKMMPEKLIQGARSVTDAILMAKKDDYDPFAIYDILIPGTEKRARDCAGHKPAKRVRVFPSALKPRRPRHEIPPYSGGCWKPIPATKLPDYPVIDLTKKPERPFPTKRYPVIDLTKPPSKTKLSIGAAIWEWMYVQAQTSMSIAVSLRDWTAIKELTLELVCWAGPACGYTRVPSAVTLAIGALESHIISRGGPAHDS